MKTVQIKAIVLYEPWASLIMCGAKPWEFRSWSYVERGVGVRPDDRVGVHASKRPIRVAEVTDLLHRLDDETVSTGLIAAKARPLLERLLTAHKCRGVLDLGALIGTARIGAPCLSLDVMPAWRRFICDSDRLEHVKWAWPMLDVRSLDAPVPVRGAQGFFNVQVPEDHAR